MRRPTLTTIVPASVLLVSVFAPITASAVTYAEARDAATVRVADVATYTRAHPDAPGAFAAWSDPVGAGEPILVHRYADLSPSYYMIPLLDERSVPNSVITIDAATGVWQGYCELRDRGPFPTVDRERAAALIGQAAGTRCDASELRAVSMANKYIYWRYESGGTEIFANLWDESDVRVGVDDDLVQERDLGTLISGDTDGSSSSAPPDGPDRPDGRYPSYYDISSVPHYYQGTSYHCGPASLEMVFDYWGVHVNQTDIGYAAAANSGYGVYTDDLRRAAHFSQNSTAPGDPTLQGYDERWCGYAASENQWSYPNTGDPDYVDRYTDLKNLISSDYPVIPLTYYDTSHSSGHFRVIKGYDDGTNVFIVHDPWYSPPYQGPNVHFNQTIFVDDLWTRYYRWALFTAPWFLDYDVSPNPPPRGTQFTFSLDVEYPGPHPFDGDYNVNPAVYANLIEAGGYEMAAGESNMKVISGISTTGTSGSTSWQMIAPCDEVPTPVVLTNYACGIVSGSSTHDASYTDQIGNHPNAAVQASWYPNIIVVDVGGSGSYTTIQPAISAAPCEHDVVQVLPGMYTGTQNKNLDFGSRNLTLEATGDPGNTFIDCGFSGRGIYLHGGQDTTTVISGFTIAAGNPSGTFTYGGGIFCDGASPKLEDMAIVESQATYGAGIAWLEASPRLRDVAIIHNTASDYGGGIFASKDSMGGRLEDVHITDNSAGLLGGGIYDTYNTFSLYDCFIHGNSSQGGGGMYIGRSAPNIVRAQIQWNTASTSGGALFIPYESEAQITRSNIIHNTTSNASYGAIQSNDSQPTIAQCIIGYNWGGGGGLQCTGPKLPTTYHSLSYANAGGDSLCGTHHDNLFRDPYFCDEPGEDLTLHSDSPCLPAYNPWSVQMGVYGDGGCGYAGIDEGQQVSVLSLGRPAPNPAPGSVSIDYETPRSQGAFRVAVYSPAGRLVKVLTDGPPDASSGRLVWDGTDETGNEVASGVYFVRATYGADTVARKLVVLR